MPVKFLYVALGLLVTFPILFITAGLVVSSVVAISQVGIVQSIPLLLLTAGALFPVTIGFRAALSSFAPSEPVPEFEMAIS